MVILLIDTSSNKEIAIGLNIDGKEHLINKSFDHRKAQLALPLIEKSLKDQRLTLTDLTEIKVNSGPGSFTGLRVGVSIANTLGFLLKIPVNRKRAIIEPVYS